MRKIFRLSLGEGRDCGANLWGATIISPPLCGLEDVP